MSIWPNGLVPERSDCRPRFALKGMGSQDMSKESRLGGSILVVDDHEVFRFGLAQLLKHSFGVDAVVEAGRFEQALRELDRADLKLVLIDLDMPGLSSVSDLAIVTDRRPDIPVVVVSGSGSRSDIIAALDAGVHGYILKSQGSEALIEKLRYVLGGEIYVPPQLADRRRGLDHDTPIFSKPLTETLGLSDRQREVLQGLIDGLSNKEIAMRIGVSEGTVKMHMAALFRALGATNRTHAAAIGKELVN